MKTFIIGDIHNHVDWIEPFLEKNDHDRVIFVGDYFDSYNDLPNDSIATAQWLLNSLQVDNRIHIMGNHDAPYRFPSNKYLECPGWTEAKHKIINNIIDKDNWNKLKLAFFEGKYIFSHAGLTEKIFKCCPINGPQINVYKEMIATEEESLKTHPNFKAVITGQNPDWSYDGLTWIRPHNIKLIPDHVQVFGHTATRNIIDMDYDGINIGELRNVKFDDDEPFILENNGGFGCVIDCMGKWVAVLEDDVLEFVTIADPDSDKRFGLT